MDIKSVDAEVPSPCVRNCCLNEDDVCLGCFRALSEITGWQQLDSRGRRQVLNNAEQRRRKRVRLPGIPG